MSKTGDWHLIDYEEEKEINRTLARYEGVDVTSFWSSEDLMISGGHVVEPEYHIMYTRSPEAISRVASKLVMSGYRAQLEKEMRYLLAEEAARDDILCSIHGWKVVCALAVANIITANRDAEEEA